MNDRDERINFRIDADLKAFIQSYAVLKGTTLTQLLTDYMIHIREEQERLVEQGIKQL